MYPLGLTIWHINAEYFAHKFKTGINNVWIAIRHGNRKVAGYFVSKSVDKIGFGFNFLHKEVRISRL